MDEGARDELRDLLRVGLHSDVEVTSAGTRGQLVSQVFCSALPVNCSSIPPARWEAFARLVLEGTYEATLCAAVLNARRTGVNVVYLTSVGGGAFGNEPAWIHDAMRRALKKVVGVALDVRLVSHRAPGPELRLLVREFAGKR